MIVFFLMVVFAPSAGFGGDTFDKAQAAAADAEKNLQHAIDTDPKVLAARRKVVKTQAALDAAINLSPDVLQAATKRYEEAQADEAHAVESAGSSERAVLAQKQKDLLAARSPMMKDDTDGRKSIDATAKSGSPVIAPIRKGDVEVRLLHVRIGPVSYSGVGSGIRLSEPLFCILVEVQNLGKESVEYVGWNTNAFASDPAEKQYLPAGVPGGTVLGRVVQVSLPAGATVRDLIVLQRPPEARDLIITLPALNIGGSGAIQFHVSRDQVELSKEPLIDRNSPAVVVQPAVDLPGSRPAVAVGTAGHSADGIEFPPVTDPNVKAGTARSPQRLPDVCKLLLFPPGKLTFPVFNTDKSGSKLAQRMSHMVDVPGARARGVTHVTRIEVDHLDPACQWFSLNVANADVAGFEVRNGVIARIVLYYRRTDSVQRMLLASYGQAPRPNASPNAMAVECGPWMCQNATGGGKRDSILKRDVWPVLPQESPATIEVDVIAANAFEKVAPQPAR
jgi:hypothetical protein